MIGLGDKLKITKVETIFVKPRWLFLKIHTNAGITGLGEPIVEGRAKTVATAIEELTPYLMGKDPRPVAHHWQAMYRHAFYRGGPILTSAISGVDQALWDIKGKALGVPVYELLGGPTRTRVRTYAHAGTVEQMKQRKAEGFTAFKTGPFKERPARIIENKAFIDKAAQRFAELRAAVGDECDIGIDFHGALSQQTARLLIKALEPYQPMFIEEPVNCQEVDVMADIARGTHLPIATGERISPNGASAKSSRRKRRRSCSRTFVTPAASPSVVSSPAWPRRITRPSRRTIRLARFRWPPASSSRRRFRIFFARSNRASASATSRNRSRCATVTSTSRPAPAWESNWTKKRWPAKSITTGATAKPTTWTTARWWIGETQRAVTISNPRARQES